MLHKSLINKDQFLSSSTGEGLRVTLFSTMDMVKYLLNKCNFKYVLTAKCNQDKIEVSRIYNINNL